MAHNVYDNWERLVKKVLHEEKLRCDAFREFSRLSVSSSFSSSSSSSFRKVEYRKPGITISKGHKNYDLMLNLQLGIRYSIGRLASAPRREVRASDFDPKLKLRNRFPPEGSKYTPPHQSVEFLWEDYCPMVFRNLRDMFKLDPMDFLVSICGYDLREISSSPGKSGRFFYLTSDDRFMIKRVKKSEIKVLMKILLFYHNHIHELKNTLITKFYSAHSFKQVGGMKARFVVMENLFYSKYQIHRRFDLKGSSYGRSFDGEIDETTTLKDLDLRYVFRLHPHLHQTLMKQIDLDCVFLEALSIMDYSLLIGVHFCDDNTHSIMGNGDSYQNLKLADGSETEQQDMDHVLAGREPLICLGANMPARAELMSRRSDFDEHNPGDSSPSHSGGISEVVIYLGISGILQDYDINKKLERAYKFLQVDPISISAVDPKLYSKRFRDFLGRVFLEDESSSASKGFKSAADSDAIWQSFLPSDYQEILSRSDFFWNGALSGTFFIDGGNKSFSLDKRSGKKRYLVGARELIIIWEDDPRSWERKSHHNSRFSQVISLEEVCWLDIRGRIETRMLSQKTNYAAYLVFSFEVDHYGFDNAAINSVIRFIDLESKSEAENRASSTIIHLQPPAREDFMSHGDQVPRSRADGWMEVEMGSFYNEQGDEGIVEARLFGFKRPHWKRGLIVEGIEFRPKCI